MTGKSHQIIGLTSGLTTYLILSQPTYNPATFAWVMVISSIAAILPDIDQPTAKIWNSLPFGRIMGELVNPFLEHRNLTHSIGGYVLISWLVYWLLSLAPSYWGINTQLIFISFLVSYGSHLLADMVTVQGIPLFFPSQRMLGIPPRPFQGMRIETGGWFENLIVFPIVNAALIAVLIVEWPIITRILFNPPH